MYRIIACFIAAFAAALTLGTTSAHADGDGNGHHCDEHVGNGHDECEEPVPVPELFTVIVGGPGNDVLFGTRGRDAIFGRAGNDRLRGKAGDDWLFGMVGNDILRGGPGTDTLRGGRGRDLCIGDTNDRFLTCERVVVLTP